jgi:hypothetical protein
MLPMVIPMQCLDGDAMYVLSATPCIYCDRLLEDVEPKIQRGKPEV